MASLTGQTIQSTYDGLLKTSDSDAITSSLKRITDGLGNFTPLYLSTTAVEVSTALTATSFIRTGGTSSQFLKADGSVDSTTYTPTSRTLTINGETYDLSANRSWTIAAGVTSFNTRTGAITLLRTDVINALGTGGSPFEFLKSDGTVDTNSYVTFGRTITINGTTQDLSANRTFSVGTVTSVSGTGTVSGLTLTGSVTSSGSLTLGGTLTLTSGQVTSALGYTPVPNTRTLTINGTTFDLTADRSWTISGGISSLNGLTGATQTFATGTSGADFNIASTGTTHTFNIPTASSSTRGLLSAADWVIFANRISGSGTTNFVPKFNGATSLANSLIFDNGTNVGINTTSPTERLHVVGNGLFSGSLTAGGDIVTPTRVAVDTINGYTGGSTPITIQTGGAQAIVLGTSSTERMRITSAGNVGIGTSSPAVKLDVSDSSTSIRSTSTATTGFGSSSFQLAAHNGSSVDARGSVFLTNSTFSYGTISPNQLNIYGTAGNGIRLVTNSAPISFATGSSDADFSTERMRITSGGNVGIGTTNPSEIVEIQRNQNATTRLLISNSDTTNTNSRASIRTNSNGVIGEMVSINSLGVYLGAASNHELSLMTNGSQRLVITSAGNVGIGTTSPTTLLDVRGFISSIGGSGSNGYQLGDYGSDAGTFSISARSGRNLVFRDEFAGAERMRITSAGNVGVGGTNPAARLEVIGGSFAVNTNTGTVTPNTTASFRSINTTATDRVLEAYSISYSALFYLQNNGSYFFAGSNLSDARAKKDITYFNEPILDKVMQLKPASFRYTQNDENIKGGFIAQEVKEIFPDLVTKTQDEDDLMGVDYYGVIALLTKAIQEQQEQINELKARLK